MFSESNLTQALVVLWMNLKAISGLRLMDLARIRWLNYFWKERKTIYSSSVTNRAVFYVSPWVTHDKLLMVYNAIRLCPPRCKEHCHNVCQRNMLFITSKELLYRI